MSLPVWSVRGRAGRGRGYRPARRAVRPPAADRVHRVDGRHPGADHRARGAEHGLRQRVRPGHFRAVQLLALLLAPLWLAWGLVELAVGSDAARFGMRLISVALSVVASVILATDPLTAQPFSKAWPLTGTHFQPVSRDALDVVQVVAVAVAE
jgi:hypothetical protein